MPLQRFIIREDGFIGYNDRVAPEFLPKGYLADALNCFMRTGEIVKRNGYTIIANTPASSACQGIKGVRFADGTKEIFAVFNGTIYYWTGSGNWNSLGGTLSTTAQVDIVVANNAVYFFDGVNTVPKVSSTNVLSTVAAIPLGKYARWFHNQLHVAGMTATPNTLQSSDVGNPETFAGGVSSTLAINPNDGDYITGLNVLKDELFIFKEKRIWAATGFGTAALTLSSIAERTTGIGTLSHRSVVNIGNELLYLSFQGNTPHFRSVIRTLYGVIVDNGIISTDIETTMNGINKAQLTNCAGIFDGRYVWWAVSNGSSSTNNTCLTYDTVTKGWSRHTGINAACWDQFAVSATPQIYFGEATATSKAYVLDTSTSDNGTAINFQAISKRYGGTESEHKNKFKRIYVRAKESGNYNVTVDYASDGFTYNNLGTLNLSGSGSVLDSIVLDTSRLGSTDLRRKSFNVPKDRSYYMQFKMYDTSATSIVTIRNWEVLGLKKRPIEE